MPDQQDEHQPTLRRVIGLPLLVFYGLGVTIGAGVFALIGEITGLAGDHAPLAFLLAGIIAAATGLSYACLASVYPKAAGEAFFVTTGLNRFAGRLVGLGVVATAIISSAVLAVAFAGYLGELMPVPEKIAVLAVLFGLGAIAWLGVRESVAFAALITVLEVGTLIIVGFTGLPLLGEERAWAWALTLPTGEFGWPAVFAASLIAFFAFIGFEDIENMAEETVNPHRNLPMAIILTLTITVVIYLFVSMIATALPDRAALTSSRAPLALLFERLSGMPGEPVAALASIAMINGILVQIVMASRVIYGMARGRLIPAWFGELEPTRRTPARAVILVTLLIVVLALTLPLLKLAQATSIVTLLVFTFVNLALWFIGRRPGAAPILRRWRYLGLVGAGLSLALLAPELYGILG